MKYHKKKNAQVKNTPENWMWCTITSETNVNKTSRNEIPQEKEEKRVSEVPLKEKRNKWKLILDEKLKLDTTE